MAKSSIIKSKLNVKNHGEVFTPLNIVRDMINLPGLKETVEELEKTVLEPSCGEGVFLVEILKRRLEKVKKESLNDILIYENLALLAISTLYGVELKIENINVCVDNIYKLFKEEYENYASSLEKKARDKILNCAKFIIKTNIVQGDFLTRTTNFGEAILFSEWKIIKNKRKTKNIKVIRTEYTLNEIIHQVTNEDGNIHHDIMKADANNIKEMFKKERLDQVTFEDFYDMNKVLDFEKKYAEKTGKEDNKIEKKYRYKQVKIEDVFKEELEEINE